MATRHRLFALFAACAPMAFGAAPAQACRGYNLEVPFLHRTLPEKAEGNFAAEVEILTSEHGPDGYSFTARIIRLLRGEQTPATVVRVEATVFTSCTHYPSVGEKGILIGMIAAAGPDEILLYPIPAPRGSHTE
ncbi:hypothetical protein [Altererythrobacter fulvus]|uniref:hypothetical protein n=1 Tax=Caenibius fulvus TaxID=2126012 RepID=UPI003018F89F